MMLRVMWVLLLYWVVVRGAGADRGGDLDIVSGGCEVQGRLTILVVDSQRSLQLGFRSGFRSGSAAGAELVLQLLLGLGFKIERINNITNMSDSRT